MKVTVLGCGPSYGIPDPVFGFRDCDPANPKNERTRSAIFVEEEGVSILFDTPPELRLQLCKNSIKKIDAVVWTHMHADHTAGIDDLRSFTYVDYLNSKTDTRTLPAYIHAADKDEFLRRFSQYTKAFTYLNQKNPPLELHLVQPDEPFFIQGVEVLPMQQDHGFGDSLGFKVAGKLSYNTDLCAFYDEKALEKLKGIKVWILDCISYRENQKHLYYEKMLEWVSVVRPERTILTHMGSHMDYETLKNKLPEGIEPAYDGMIIEI